MARIQSTRKARFKAACALTGISQTKWAESHDVKREHLAKVLADDRESQRLTALIDAFIADVEQKAHRKAAA